LVGVSVTPSTVINEVVPTNDTSVLTGVSAIFWLSW